MDKLKNNLSINCCTYSSCIAIGGGFAKFGEMQTKLDALSSAKGVDISGLEMTVQDLEKDIAIIKQKTNCLKQ